MYITFVYVSNLFSKREQPWKDIICEADTMDAIWRITGDFNNVLSPKDKKGGLPVPFSHIRGFSNCLLTCGMAEANIKGYKFTWRRRGVATHIDKVQVNANLLTTFPNFNTVALTSAISDHNPIFIQLYNTSPTDKGKQFRYINNWHLIQGYCECVYNGLQATTWGDRGYNLIHKLKQVKLNLKNWNRNRDKIDCAITKLEEQYEEELLRADTDPTDVYVCNAMYETGLRINKQLHAIHENYKQKSKISWMTQGDKCSKKIHARMSMRRHNNNIQSLFNAQGELLYDHKSIEEEVINYYTYMYNYTEHLLMDLHNIKCRKVVNQQGKQFLFAAVTSDEVKNAVFSFDDSKSPDPDGFFVKFFKLHWNDIKEELLAAIQEVFNYNSLPKVTNHTFITLILKMKDQWVLMIIGPLLVEMYSIKLYPKLYAIELNFS